MSEFTPFAGPDVIPERPYPIVVGEPIIIDAQTAAAFDESFGIPYAAAEAAREQVAAALTARAIDPHAVVFSGYYGRDSQVKDNKGGEFAGSAPITNELEMLRGELCHVADPQLQEQLTRRIGLLEQRLTLPPGQQGDLYYFGTFMDLQGDDDLSPLAHMATSENAVLGVYDLHALHELGYDGMTNTVVATLQELEGLKVMEFWPTFVIEDDT